MLAHPSTDLDSWSRERRASCGERMRDPSGPRARASASSAALRSTSLSRASARCSNGGARSPGPPNVPAPDHCQAGERGSGGYNVKVYSSMHGNTPHSISTLCATHTIRALQLTSTWPFSSTSSMASPSVYAGWAGRSSWHAGQPWQPPRSPLSQAHRIVQGVPACSSP